MTADGIRRYVDPTAPAQLARWTGPKRALFLDRDGVVNVDRGYVHSADATTWVPGIFDLVRAARAAGYLPIVVTNQAGIARGYYSEDQFLEYTAWVHASFRGAEAPLLATFYCPHHPTAGIGVLLCECACRKPRPGMLLAAAEAYALDLAQSRLIGDTQGDLGAARNAGLGDCRLYAPGTAGEDTFGDLRESEPWLVTVR